MYMLFFLVKKVDMALVCVRVKKIDISLVSTRVKKKDLHRFSFLPREKRGEMCWVCTRGKKSKHRFGLHENKKVR